MLEIRHVRARHRGAVGVERRQVASPAAQLHGDAWFGLPNARRRRITQSSASDIADVDGEAELNTTDSGP